MTTDERLADWTPESEAMLADAVGLALLAALDALQPTERLAFVLHEVFGMAFDEIAPIAGCSPADARQLARRAGRRVRNTLADQERVFISIVRRNR